MTPEDVIQQKCVIWFRNNYGLKTQTPRYILFSVPNSGKDVKEQSYKKATGMMPGVSDLILLMPNGVTIFIEMKTEKGRQSDSQTEFENAVKQLGFVYIVCRSFEQFQLEINNLIPIK
tara:strand:- start:189 stop:542 length:354 start_codon:yes stop_codon:yes gene_type:complete